MTEAGTDQSFEQSSEQVDFSDQDIVVFNIFQVNPQPNNFGYVCLSGDTQNNRVLSTVQLIPQIFWKVYRAYDDPTCFNFTCFDVAGELCWLSGNSNSNQLFISHQQSAPGSKWRCTANQYGSFKIFCQDVPGANKEILIAAPPSPVSLGTLESFDFPYNILQFKLKDTIAGVGKNAYARLLFKDLVLCANPQKGNFFCVQGTESVAPLCEVWWLQQIDVPNQYQISVVSNLSGPKYLSSDPSTGRIWLADSPDRAYACWALNDIFANGSWYISPSGDWNQHLSITSQWGLILSSTDPTGFRISAMTSGRHE